MTEAADDSDTFQQLDHFRAPYQVMMPWGGDLATASFQVGASGVTGIQVTPWGVEIDVRRSDGKQWVIMFTNGGMGYRSVSFPCDQCDQESESETAASAHKRSHKPNHKGDGK